MGNLSLVYVHSTFTRFFINSLTFSLGPVAQYHENSRYYSAVRPSPNKEVDAALPHITVELPVFKESLEQTMSDPSNIRSFDGRIELADTCPSVLPRCSPLRKLCRPMPGKAALLLFLCMMMGCSSSARRSEKRVLRSIRITILAGLHARSMTARLAASNVPAGSKKRQT